MNFNLNDVVKFKKKHPCGGQEWKIIRTGSDFKLECTTCERIILLTKENIIKSLNKKQK